MRGPGSIGQARVLRGYLNLFFPLYLCNFNCNIVTLLLFCIQVGTWITFLTSFICCIRVGTYITMILTVTW